MWSAEKGKKTRETFAAVDEVERKMPSSLQITSDADKYATQYSRLKFDEGGMFTYKVPCSQYRNSHLRSKR